MKEKCLGDSEERNCISVSHPSTAAVHLQQQSVNNCISSAAAVRLLQTSVWSRHSICSYSPSAAMVHLQQTFMCSSGLSPTKIRLQP